MKKTVCLLLCVAIVATEHTRARTGVNESQLSSRIIGGTDPREAEASYTASLQVNEVHICCAGMFKPGFLVSSAKCVIKIRKQLEDSSRRGSAVLGHKDLRKGERCNILGLKVHPYFISVKEVDKNWNRDVGVVMVEVSDYMMTLNFPILQEKTPAPIRKMNGTLCGWDDTIAHSINASSGTADITNDSRCMVLKILNIDICRSLARKVLLDYRSKYMCGSANNPMHRITSGDDGSPLIIKFYKNTYYRDYIIGVTTDQIEDDHGVFIRFLRIRSIYEQIITMVNILTFEGAQNIDCVRNNQRDLLGRPIKRQKTNTEE